MDSFFNGPSSSNTGMSVSLRGDFNDDGLSDVVIGAMNDGFNGITQCGGVYVIYGIKTDSFPVDYTDLNGVNGFAFYGNDTSDKVGRMVRLDGDFNKDGIDDLLISGNGRNRGYILYGNKDATQFPAASTASSLNGINGITFLTADADERVTAHGSIGGDFNGDGYADMLISTHYADSPNNIFIEKTYIWVDAPSPCPNLDEYLSLPSKTCSTSCSQGSTYNHKTNYCDPCHSNCLACEGPTKNDCSQCASGFFLFPNSSTCDSQSCPSGYWQNSIENTCDTCLDGCATCTDDSTCQSCQPGFFLTAISTCETCNPICKECYGPKSVCSSCIDGYVLAATSSSDTSRGACKVRDEVVILEEEVRVIVNSISNTTKGTSTAISTTVITGQILAGGTSSLLVTVANSLQLTSLLMYCTAGFPDNVDGLFEMVGENLNLMPNPLPSSIQSSSDVASDGEEQQQQYVSQRYRFKRFGDSVNILDHCGGALNMITISIFVIVLVKLLQLCGKRSITWQRLLSKVLTVFEWNNTLSYALGAQVDFAFGLALQLSEPVLTTFYGVLNLIVAIAIIISTILLYTLISKLNRWNYEMTLILNKNDISEPDAVKDKRAKLNVLWSDYSLETKAGRSYLLLSLLKNILIVISIASLQSAPLLQAITLCIVSITFLVIICVGKPYNGKEQAISGIVNEALWTLQTFLVLYFASAKTANKDRNTSFTAGWVFIGTMFATFAFNLLFSLYAVICQIVQSCKALRSANSTKKKTSSAPKVDEPVSPNVVSFDDRDISVTKQLKKPDRAKDDVLSNSFSLRIPVNKSSTELEGLNKSNESPLNFIKIYNKKSNDDL